MNSSPEMEPESELAIPDAALAESLRGVGYSLPAAIADIIDNSISAKARNVRLSFEWEGQESWIKISDDGEGMTNEELSRAMRLGARSPLESRSVDDLGRFGIGLKTASFSQCRRLTVASRKTRLASVKRWDLDYLGEKGSWHILAGCSPGSEKRLDLGHEGNGTVVLLERLDRVPGVLESNNRQGEDAFLSAIDSVEIHLSMVFHRYIEGASPDLNIFINGSAVKPWDPFLSSHAATIRRPREPIRSSSGTVYVTGFILPHKDRITASEWENGGGPEGWAAQQGFYVYRNRRLLLAGSWLGLGSGRSWTKEEAYKLARLQLDIQNTADTDWKIDIKKSSAKPPTETRQRLREIADDVRTIARNVFAHRGDYGTSQPDPALFRVWKSHASNGIVKYRIDREHPLVKEAIEHGGDNAVRIESMLRVIEETVPVQKIWLDATERGEIQEGGLASAPPKEVEELLAILYGDMRRRIGLSPEQAKAQLLRTEPFNRFPGQVHSLSDNTGGANEERI